MTEEPLEQMAETGPEAIDAISDEEAMAAAPQFSLPSLQIPVSGNARVVKDAESGERALIVGPVLVSFILPFSQEAAAGIARELTGGIEIATVVPR